MLTLFVVIGATFFLTYYFSKSSKTVLERRSTFTVGIIEERPPFVFKRNNAFTGFDIDLVNAVAEKLGREVKFIPVTYFDIVDVLHGKVDFVIGGISMHLLHTKYKDCLFLEYEASSMIGSCVVRLSDANLDFSLNKIYGVGFEKGSSEEMQVEAWSNRDEIFGKVKLVSSNSFSDLVDSLKEGFVSAAFVSKSHFILMDEREKGVFTCDEVVPPSFAFVRNSSGASSSADKIVFKRYAMLFSDSSNKSSKNVLLIGEVKKALKEIQDSGEIDEMKLKWIAG